MPCICYKITFWPILSSPHSVSLAPAIQLTSVEEQLASRQAHVEALEQSLKVADAQLSSLQEALVAAAQGSVEKFNKKRTKTMVTSTDHDTDENVGFRPNKVRVDENKVILRMRQPFADV